MGQVQRALLEKHMLDVFLEQHRLQKKKKKKTTKVYFKTQFFAIRHNITVDN